MDTFIVRDFGMRMRKPLGEYERLHVSRGRSKPDKIGIHNTPRKGRAKLRSYIEPFPHERLAQRPQLFRQSLLNQQ